MLDVVSQLRINFEKDMSFGFGVPKQLVVSDTEMFAPELDFPVIAKPLVADGSTKSHEICLIFDKEGLEELKTRPVVLQEFVNHGGVVFKVYVVGSHVVCVKRKSLPDISAERMKSLKGCLPFSQISNNKEKGEDDCCCVEMPSENFVVELGKGLREAMGLNLFNFDLIRDGRDCNTFLVIDINYFPGYEKMPDFESVLTDFLLEVVKKKNVEVVKSRNE